MTGLILPLQSTSNHTNLMVPRKRTRRQNHQPSEDSDLDYQHSYDPNSDGKRSEQTRTRAAKNKVTYTAMDQPSKENNQQQESIQQQVQYPEVYDFLTPKVECLLWKAEHQDPEQQRFLVKFMKKSYHQAIWMTRKELKNINFQVNSNTNKSLKIKMRKTLQLKLKQGEYFNPNFLIPDRILSSTEIFTAIHHKRANDIKGKWDETILIVAQKILNFVKNGYPYGILLHQPYNQELQKQVGIQQPINIGQIISKVYLGYYKNHFQFWLELGRAIRNYLLIYPKEKGDYFVVGSTIRECAIFLYQQWHYLCRHRYFQLREQLIASKIIPEKMIDQNEGNYQPLSLAFLTPSTIPTSKTEMTAQANNKPLKSEQTSLVNGNGVNINNASQQIIITAFNHNLKKEEEEQNVITPEMTELNEKKIQDQKPISKPIPINIISEFCKTNIFLTQKSVDTPTNEEEFQLLNPGKYLFDWLQPQNTTQFKEITLKYINHEDLQMLDINTEIDKLFYVKWKDLSYNDITWESQRYINSPEKIEQFKTWNKIPVKEIRERFQMHNKVHKFLIEYNEYIGDKKLQVHNVNVTKMETKMYRLDASQRGTPRQYGDKDIPIFKNYRKLKDFQLESLNWLIKSWYQNKNTILADEMGLGKTIQTIAFLYHLYTYEHVIGPFLILAPLTTLQQWRREIEEWTSFNCLLYYDEGRGDVREIIQQYQFFHLHTTKTGDIISSKLPKFQILLTNYQLFVNDFEILYKIPFQHVVLDQAHRLKNRSTKTTITLTRLPCVRKTLLTGTPIQNNTKELWTLLNFIEPRAFANEQQFLQEYAELSTEQQVKNFKKMLKPYLLRRVKEDVESTIPKLSETIIDVEMSALQKAYYKGIFQKNKTMLKSLSSANFNSISIQLRKCCNHPYLISPQTEAQIKYGAVTEQEQTNKFIKASGKTILLMKLLQKFKKEGKKVLLFSQFVLMLDLLKPYLQVSGFNCQILKGSQSSTIRHQAITRFTQQQTDIFLISTKAGGVGINLVAATEIVIYDSDWNPQNDIQATARAHRIGQKKEVNVYRLITANSYQSEMFQMSSKKLGLDKAIFTGDTFKSMGEFDDAQKQLTKIQIEMLLKKGIIGFLDNQINEEQYFSQPIEDILQKNARKVEYAISQSSCTFSKTKFKSDQSNDIKMDAPDFWEQALKDIQTPLDRLVKKRSQLKQYSTIESQQALMLQTYRIVLQFVKHKTLGTGFNAQEERNLLRFLEAINSERHINRQLRDIADLLSLEIIKPSRRFKVKEEDIFAITNTHTHELRKQAPVIDKNLRIKRLKRHHEEVENLGLEPQLEDQNSGVSEEPYEDSPKSQQVEKNEKNEEQEKIDEQFQKLCSFCEKPKCSIFCGGVCGRAFHKKCFQTYNNQSQLVPQTYQLDEVLMEAQKLRETKLHDLQCFTCKEKNYNFKCSVCLKEGKYVEEEVVPPSKSKKSVKIKKEPKEADENSVFKCSFPGKCSRFYHLACLFSQQFQGKFSDHTGKAIKDISATTRQFRCPSHYCNSCYGIDPKSTKLKSYTCIRCCRTFHDKCLDKEKFHRFGTQHYYICTDHLQNVEEADRFTIQLRKFLPSKKDRLEQKKRAKQAKKYRAQIQPLVKEKQIKKQEKIKEKEQDNGLRRSKRIRGGEVPQEQEVQTKPVKLKQEVSPMIDQKQQQGKSTSQIDQNGQIKASFESKKNSHSKSKNKKSIKKQNKEIMNISQKSEMQKSKKQSKESHQTLEWRYEDYKLTPIAQFDFSVYSGNWCRYCGARYANKFEEGPWQGGKLCQHHYEQWKKGKLRLEKYKSQPKKPINKSKQNEIRFLNEFSKKNKLTPEQTFEVLNKNQSPE